MGNPPFVGARMIVQGSQQKQELQDIFGNIKDVQDLDYVTCWYKIAAQMMAGTEIETAFVSTNSVSQGSQVPILWNVLLNEYHVHINFAHRTFKWNSESANKAAVHCVIIGFSCVDRKVKTLFSQGVGKKVENIGPYLVESGDYFVTAQKIALCGAPKMSFGNQPRDRSVGKVGFLKFVLLKSFEKRTFSNKAIIIGAHKSAKFFKTGLCQQVHFEA